MTEVTRNKRRTSPAPLTWWRTIPFADLDSRSADALADALRNIEILGDGRWRRASSGDTAAAVGCAMRLWSAGVLGPSLDLAMTAVLMCALRGDRAARVVLIHASRTRAIIDKEDRADARRGRRTAR